MSIDLGPNNLHNVVEMVMQLVEELLPDVEDAPILGGHNRNPRPTNALADRPQQHAPAFTPESSMEFESPEDGSVPSFGVLGHQLPQPSSRVGRSSN